MDRSFFSGLMKMFWTQIVVIVVLFCEYTKIIELYIPKRAYFMAADYKHVCEF